MELNYHLARGRSLDIVRAWQARARATAEAARTLTEEVGAEHACFRRIVCGFAFRDDQAPDGWERKGAVDGRPYFVPSKRTKAGRELWRRMQTIVYPDAWTFQALLGGGEEIVDGRTFVLPTFETLGEDVVIKLAGDFQPPDAIPLKQSEYWARKEAAQGEAA